MKDKMTPCEYYVCAGADCLKGRKEVTIAKTCKNCQKYSPRKTGNAKVESIKTRKEKSRNKEFKKMLKDY